MTAFVGDILSATAASVTGDPTPSRTWAWLRSGSAISGQTASTYRVTETDVGSSVSALQTETNFIGATSAASNPLAISSWSPSSLFSASEPGIWLDPSDLTTMFQDRFGVTPVTAPGQFVGLRLDESRGLVLGSEQVLQGDNEASLMGTTWQNPVLATNGTVVRSTEQASTGSASAKFTSNTASSVPHYVTFGMVPAGLSVRITGRAYLPTGSLASLVVADISDGSIIQPIVTSVKDAWVSFTITRVAKATAWPLAIGNNANEALLGAAFYLDDISIKELPGNHAAVTDDLNRGIYGIEPLGGRRNLLTFTEQFDNAAWTKQNCTILTNSAIAPDGTSTADKIQETAVTAAFSVGVAPTMALSTTHTLSVYMKAVERSFGVLNIFTGAASCWTWYDLASGTVGTVGSGATASISNVGNGWYRCVLTIATAASGSPNVAMWPATANNTLTYAGTAGSGILIWGAQLETGSTATAYQRVVDQYNVTEAGVPTLHYVQYDGSNDGYVTPTITPGTDKVQVFAGVRKLSDALVGTVVETSAGIGGNNGSIQLAAPFSGANYTFQSRGTTQQAASYTSAAIAAPVTNVVTGVGDISADISTLRVNGAQVAQNTVDQGTGNYLAYPMYIGRRGGSSLPFNGRDYGVIVRFGANLSTSNINRAEYYMAQKTGVTL